MHIFTLATMRTNGHQTRREDCPLIITFCVVLLLLLQQLWTIFSTTNPRPSSHKTQSNKKKTNKVGNFWRKMVVASSSMRLRLGMMLWMCILSEVCWLCRCCCFVASSSSSSSSLPPVCPSYPSSHSKIPPFLVTFLSQCHLSSYHHLSPPLEVIFFTPIHFLPTFIFSSVVLCFYFFFGELVIVFLYAFLSVLLVI